MKKLTLLLILLTAISLLSCDDGLVDQPGWLFMFYMDGDNNLESALWSDINEIEKGMYDLFEKNPNMEKNFHAIVLWDGYSAINNGDSAVYELGPESKNNDELSYNTIELYPDWLQTEMNMGDGETLTNFVEYARNMYPNLNEVLIFSNHGSGVRDIESAVNRAVCYDDTNGHDVLHTNEIQEALTNAGVSDSNPIDVIGMDACLMGMVEEAYEYRTLADYAVLSPETEPGSGWNFEDLIPRIKTAATPKDFSQIIVMSYRDAYPTGYNTTLTAVVLSEIEELKLAIDKLAEAMFYSGNEGSVRLTVTESLKVTTPEKYYYINDICNRILNDNPTSYPQTLKDKARDVLTALGNSVVYAWRNNSVNGYDGRGSDIENGLTIYADSSSLTWYTDQNAGEGEGLIDFCTITDDQTINSWTELIREWYF